MIKPTLIKFSHIPETCIAITFENRGFVSQFEIWLRDDKTLLQLNTAEHEIYPAHKSQITNNCKLFLAKHG